METAGKLLMTKQFTAREQSETTARLGAAGQLTDEKEQVLTETEQMQRKEKRKGACLHWDWILKL
jgi:hypothetical protein